MNSNIPLPPPSSGYQQNFPNVQYPTTPVPTWPNSAPAMHAQIPQQQQPHVIPQPQAPPQALQRPPTAPTFATQSQQSQLPQPYQQPPATPQVNNYYGQNGHNAQPQPNQYGVNQLANDLGGMSVTQKGFNKSWQNFPNLSNVQYPPTSVPTWPNSAPAVGAQMPPQQQPHVIPQPQPLQRPPPPQVQQIVPGVPPRLPTAPTYATQSQQSQLPQPYQQPPAAPQVNNYYGQNGHNAQPQPNQYGANQLANDLGGMSVTQQGFNKLWGIDNVDLLKQRTVLPPQGIQAPEIRFQHEYMNSINCSPDIFRCSVTRIPETKTLLQKSRLPLGILIHPFKDLSVSGPSYQLPVIQCSTIVRCRSCRTYINPYVYFIDQRRWKCNLCFRVNDLPEEFLYDPMSKTCGDPSKRPEVKSATIEFVAPADYMVRPPQAAIYLFVMDITANAVDTGYLKTVCDTLLEELEKIPGDSRTQIGFITFDTSIHFYKLSADLSQPHQLIVCDIEDVFIPCPNDLLVSVSQCKDNIKQLLTQLPTKFLNTSVNQSALGAALQAAHKLLAPIGGRITVFQTCLPTVGPGALINREGSVKNVKDLTSALNPTTDFYKKLALECSQQYIAVDLFFLNNQYVDIATISCISKYSGGCIHQFPNYHITRNATQSYHFEQVFQRYLVRKVGFEAVMRIRCSRGLSIHTFHGNFFVRSTDLLSLPNCNPDSGFGMQVSIDEPLTDFQTVCFQAALLYTSSKGERRIRVHTLCLPVTGNINDVLNSADQQCMIGLLAKMAVDRSLSSSLLDAREAFINAVVDALSAYMVTQNSLPQISLLAPAGLSMLAAYTHAVLRSPGFRTDLKVKLDDRAQYMNQMKSLPLVYLIQSVYPDLYAIHDVAFVDCSEDDVPQFTLLQLCSDRVDAHGVYLMDMPHVILVYVCRSVAALFCQEVFGVSGFSYVNEMNEFPELETTASVRIRNFVSSLQGMKPQNAPVRIIRDDSRERMLFVNNMVEDRGESSASLYEFLQQLKNMVK